MTLQLRTFGAVYLAQDQTPLGGAHSQRRRLALLAYLAAADGAAITRDKLITLLWPESDAASGRHSLSQLLYSLRHDLGNDALVVDSETVRLNPVALPSDVHAFAEGLRAGQLANAVEHYRGAFLDGFHIESAPEFDRWIDEERARYAAACGRALERLADAAAQAGDKHANLEWWRRRAALDPADARVTLRLMQALAAIGDRDGALRAARVYETLLRDEFAAEPDRAVLQFADELRHPAPHVPSRQRPGATAGTRDSTAAPRAEPVAAAKSNARRSTRIAWRWSLGTLAVVGLLVFATMLLRRARAPASDARGASSAIVVLGDLQGPDSVLSLAVREALRAELVNTRGVVLTSDLSIRELKRLMRLTPDAELAPPQLLALAMRGGAHVAVAGSVLPVGSGAQIVLELLEPNAGSAVRTFRERSIDATGILAAVERIGRSLGEAISHRAPDPGVRPLPAVTTASLPALKSYAQARQLAASGKRHESIAPAERAVTHDSSFALAHYFLGDILWFIDQQSHAEAHLTKAYELLPAVPPREQLVIRARYEQLVLDRPDSALIYWDLLHDASPGDVLVYEGRAWALRALGRHEEAAASADTAMRLDPAAVAPNTNNAMYSLLGVGDTTGALAVAERVAQRNPDALTEARFFAALFRGDVARALALADSTRGLSARIWRRHFAHLANADLTSARIAVDSLRVEDAAAYLPNALLNLGLFQLTVAGDGASAAASAREALEWARRRDLSPPALGRLAERVADVAARSGDAATVQATLTLVRERDRGRALRSYVMALRTLEAARAFVRGQYAEAARRAEAARHGVYFSRSLNTIVQLEADARRAAGETAAPDSLERLIATHQIVDGNYESWTMVKAVGMLRARGRSAIRSRAVAGRIE